MWRPRVEDMGYRGLSCLSSSERSTRNILLTQGIKPHSNPTSWLWTLQQHRQKGMCCLGETSMRGLAAWKVWLVHCSGNKQTPHAINMAGFYSAFVTQHPPCFAQAGLQVMKLLPSLFPCMVGVVALALIMSWFRPQSWAMFKVAL